MAFNGVVVRARVDSGGFGLCAPEWYRRPFGGGDPARSLLLAARRGAPDCEVDHAGATRLCAIVEGPRALALRRVVDWRQGVVAQPCRQERSARAIRGILSGGVRHDWGGRESGLDAEGTGGSASFKHRPEALNPMDVLAQSFAEVTGLGCRDPSRGKRRSAECAKIDGLRGMWDVGARRPEDSPPWCARPLRPGEMCLHPLGACSGDPTAFGAGVRRQR